MAGRVKKNGNTVRIIAGSMRGRRITFPDADGLRPTGDRLRETLFSWLHEHLPGSHCLDMFAGSGVLGFESISRGASCAVLLEQSRAVCGVLQDNVGQLGIDNATVGCVDAMQPASLQRYCEAESISIAYIDPPFASHLQQAAISTLAASGVLAEGALVAVESGRRDARADVPSAWQMLREKTAGEVRLQLYRVTSASSPA